MNKFYKNKQAAFTLAEILITLGIIGIMIVILMPILLKSLPNGDKVLIRKCHYTIKNNIYRMLNNTATYPADERLASNDSLFFCERFAEHLKTNGPTNCAISLDTPFATTVDGVQWFLDGENFSNDAYSVRIYFDVNGNKPPNCSEETCNEPDRFYVGIRGDGKLNIDTETQTKLQEILSDYADIKK